MGGSLIKDLADVKGNTNVELVCQLVRACVSLLHRLPTDCALFEYLN